MEGSTPDREFEDYPLTRTEYIGAMVHLYRGERGRADSWRERLDPTTNWAVVTAGAMLSFAFNTPEHSHVTLLLGMLLVLVFLGFEARRFRYFDVWRCRVRMIEENFWIPMLRRNLVSGRKDWRELMARDLDRPTFKMGFREAVAIRLRYNYLWIVLALFVSWIAKLHIHPTGAETFGVVVERAAIGPFPGWAVMGSVLLFVIVCSLLARTAQSADDEVFGEAADADSWRT